MLKSIFQKIHNVEHLFLRLGTVLGTQVKNDALSPLVEVLDPIEQVDYESSRDFDTSLVSFDFIDSFDGVYNDESIGVGAKLLELLNVGRIFLES